MTRNFLLLFSVLGIFRCPVLGDIPDSLAAAAAAAPVPPVVRSIRIEGNDVTHPSVILREMSIHPGDIVSQSALDHDRDRIYDLGLFNKVTITHADSAGVSDLTVTVVERWYIIPSPVLNLRSRSVNTASYGLQITDQNFIGRNERLSAGFSAGYNKSGSLSFQTPRLRGGDDIYIGASLQYRESHSVDYNTDVATAQINRTASFSLGRRFGLYQSVIATAGYQVWQLPDTTFGRTNSPDGTDRFGEAGLDYTFDARNVREYPTDGFYVDLGLTYDGIGRFSTVRNLRIVPDLRLYEVITGEFTLAMRGFGSFITGGAVPSYHLLYLNNRLGIRGYNPREYSGEDIAGVSAEIRLPLIAPRFMTVNLLDIHQFNTMRFGVYAVLFIDAGKIWSRPGWFGSAPWLTSAGMGLHILLPYGFTFRPELSVNGLGQFQIGVNGAAVF